MPLSPGALSWGTFPHIPTPHRNEEPGLQCSVPPTGSVSRSPDHVSVTAPASSLRGDSALRFCISDSCDEEEFHNGTNLTPPEKISLQIPLLMNSSAWP